METRQRFWSLIVAYQNQILAVAIPLILLPLPIIANGDEKAMCGFVLLWMAIYYIVRVVPLGVTATLPIFMFPLLGVLSSAETAASYSSEAVWVQFGTLICGVAFEKVGLHRRLAFVSLKFVGPKPVRLIWTFGFLSFCVSMFTTNVAAAIAILTIVEAMVSEREALLESMGEAIQEDDDTEGEDNTAFDASECEHDDQQLGKEEKESIIDDTTVVFKQLSIEVDASSTGPDAGANSYNLKDEKSEDDNWGYALGNAVKFGCTLGGMSSPMGSALNILILELLADCYEDSNQSSPLTFAIWMACLLPVCLVMLCLICFGLQFYFIGFRKSLLKEPVSKKKAQIEGHLKEWISKEYESLGSISYAEVVVGILFIALALFWFFMSPGFMPGWAELPIFKDGYIGSAVPTFIIGFLLFVIPVKPCICGSKADTADSSEFEPIMDWATVRRQIPWQLPMLFGAGLASAAGSKASGLDVWLGDQVMKLSHLDPGMLVFLLCLMAAYVTEILSTSMMLNMFLPIMCEVSVILGKSPAYLVVPVALCINTNFMMPNQMVNALILQFNKSTVLQLIATGFVADLFYVALITISSLTWFGPLLKYDDPFFTTDMNATTASIMN